MKKRVLSLLLALSLFFSLATVTGVTVSAATIDLVEPTKGDGTADNPYQIGTVGELYWFAKTVNGGETAINAVLTADITINEGVLDADGNLNSGDFEAWTAIGNYDNRYIGTFDGAGHTLSGVYLDGGSTQGIGLFGTVGSGGKVCNLGVTDSYFKGNTYWIGAVCGYNKSIITNCYADATVVGNNDVGGVCGQNAGAGTITNCYSVGKVSGNSNVGGVCGCNYGDVTNCYYDSTVYSGDAIGTNEDTAVEVSGKSTAQFASGEVCYLLNGKTSMGELVWGQTIGTDDYPVFNNGSNTVYSTTGCVSYNNDGKEGEQEHNVVDGKCTACGLHVISTAEQLFSFAAAVNGGETAINAVLTADITINEGVLDADGNLNSGDFAAWTIIGCDIYYIGTFDGAGHIISGLYLDGGITMGVGLFGKVGSGGKVCNLGVTDSYFKSNRYQTGAVCGLNEGIIENCYANATVVGNNSVGGVCGHNAANGTITNCYSVGKVSGDSNVGAVCGYNQSIITNCYNAGAVSGNNNVGGVCGHNDYVGKITKCYNAGAVSGNSNVGGVCGCNYGKITNCYYDSTVYSGDAIGMNDGTAVDVRGKSTTCFASGEVAYLLNGKTSKGELVWGQKIGTDVYPVFNDGSNTVYVTTGCVSYTNDGNEGEKEHNIVDGKCTVCGFYVISTAEQLFSFAAAVNGGETAISAVLTADITINEGVLDADGNLNSGDFEAWTAIGNLDNRYIGTFDGAGHTVSGLYLDDASEASGGLFGFVGESGIVTNVGIADFYFKGSAGIGGLCGNNYGKITNCFARGTVFSRECVGGLCAANYGEISNCYAVATVSGQFYSGSFCGYNDGKITNCCAYGSHAVNNNNGTSDNVFSKKIAQFKSGEVAYTLNLNDGTDNDVWGQTIGTDDYPVLGGAKVYATTGCVIYTNNAELNGTVKEHGEFVNDICPDCGEYKAAEEIDGVYQIGTVTDLYWFAQAVNSGNTEIDAVLTADITVNKNVLNENGELSEGSFKEWTPIGDYNNKIPYNGVFNGQNHTISGLYFNDASASEVGLFGCVGKNGGVTNVGVVDSYFSGNNGVGGVCGYNEGQILFSYFTGTVSGENSVGGVCGANFGLIVSCYSAGVLSGKEYVGGVCGFNGGQIALCYYDRTVYGGSAIGDDSGTVLYVFGKTTAQFASGEVAYMLNPEQFESGEGAYMSNSNQSAPRWGQTIGTDDYPVLGGAKVYATTGCVTYTNNAELNGTAKEHGEFVNGMCPVCGEYEAAELNKETDEYEISNAGQLYWFAEQVNRGNTEIDAVLTADITVNENVLNENGELSEGSFKDWTPIGNDGNQYNGTFDGAGHTVSGLYFNNPSANDVGLFGCVGENGVMSNVGIVDSYFSGNYGVGGVCGYNDGEITNCYSVCKVSGDDFVGGVCGKNYGWVTNCYYDRTIYGGSAIGRDDGYSNNVLGKTTAQFTRGEVCYLLNQNDGIENDVWGQTIGTDKYPTVHNDNNTVYATTGCVTYKNDASISGTVKEHGEFVNGMCPDCGEYEAAVQNTETGVYEISNAGQLYWFAAQVNGGNKTINAVLTADITVNENVLKSDGTLNGSGFMAWTPIGDYDNNQYNGTFDGAGHYISGLYFNNTSACDVGFIGCVGEYGVVTNVGIVDSYINANEYVGGICGDNLGKVINCYFSGTVNGTFDIGGVCGYSEGEIINCYYDSTVYGGSAIGGDDGVSDNVLGKTTAQFASGEVAYLLQSAQKADENGIVPQVWGQTIGTDKAPVFGGAKVYNAMVYAGCAGNPGESTGYKYSNKEVVYAEHDMTHIKAKAPTCTEEGNLEYWICSYEDGVYYKNEAGTEKYASYDEIKTRAAGHTEETIHGKAATCTEDGLTDGKKCSVCGEILVEQQVISKKGHTEEIIKGKDATCTEDGLTDGKKCSVCGEILVEQKVIPVTGHDFKFFEEVPATHESEGVKAHYVCSECEKLFDVDKNELSAEDLVIPKLAIEIIYGDANGDGKVTATDVLLIRKSIAGQKISLNFEAADVNCDGKLTASDVLLIRKFIAGQNVHLGK